MEEKELQEWRDRLIKMFGVYHSDGQEYVTCPLCGINLDELANYMIKELDKARGERKIPDAKRFNKLVDRKVAERLQKIAENIPCNYIGANEMAINILNKEARSILREELSKLATK